MKTETCYCSVILFLMINCSSWQLVTTLEIESEVPACLRDSLDQL